MVASLLRVRIATGRTAQPYQSAYRLAADSYNVRNGSILVIPLLSEQGEVATLRRVLVLPIRGDGFLCFARCRRRFCVHWSKPCS